MSRVISYTALFLLFHFTVAVGEPITGSCNLVFTGTPTEIEVSNDDSLGSNVCINQADTSPSVIGLWHFISCPGANHSKYTSSDKGGALFCLKYKERRGIGIDFPSGEATVERLQLECERQIGTTLKVINITVYFRRERFIGYVDVSGDGNVSVSVGEKQVIAKFVGLESDLDTIVAPDGVTCITTPEADNCRFIGGGSEMTRTCTVTPQGETDSGEKVFSVSNGTTLAIVNVNVNVVVNSTEETPTTAPPTLSVGEIVGITFGVVVSVILILILILVTTVLFSILYWHIVRKRSLHDAENGNGPKPLLKYVTFGEGIPQEVKTEFVKDSKLEEFRLNGSTVEDRFGQGREKFLHVTRASEHNATTPSGDPGSTLTAQMLQLASTQSGRVLIVTLPDEALHLAGQQGTDGGMSVLSIINEQMQQQLASDLQRQASTESRFQTMLESVHNMAFDILRRMTPNGTAASATNPVHEPNEQARDRDEELPG